MQSLPLVMAVMIGGVLLLTALLVAYLKFVKHY